MKEYHMFQEEVEIT